MAYKGPHGITILEGLEAVRRGPEMYIDVKEVHPFPRVRLLEYVVDDIAHEPQAEILILLWCKDTITIAYDGGSLPIEPFSLPANGVAIRPSTSHSCMASDEKPIVANPSTRSRPKALLTRIAGGLVDATPHASTHPACRAVAKLAQ
jgi:hypothetical protein